MSSQIVIRLLPEAPIDQATFVASLADLHIAVFDLTFNSVEPPPPRGLQVGPTVPFLKPKNTITLFPNPASPNDPPHSSVAPKYSTAIVSSPFSGIVQDFYTDSSGFFVPAAVATAVINITSGQTVFENLRVVMTRGASSNAEQIPVGGPFYVVPLSTPSVQAEDFPTLPASLYLTLPPSPSPNTVNFAMPTDGSPPLFKTLFDAVKKVLASDPGAAAPDLSGLTAAQCTNIAYEIVWSSQPPLPKTTDEIDLLYTKPPNDGSVSSTNPKEQERRQFEGELQAYYATRNATAGQLSKFVYSLAAAFACAKRSLNAQRALIELPILSGQTITGPVAESAVVLLAPGNNPFTAPISFEVPAAYFYALDATKPNQIGPDLRYQMATGNTLAHNLSQLTSAIDSGIVKDSESTSLGTHLSPAQAARRLAALGALGGSSTPVCVLTPLEQPLVLDWLAYPPTTPPSTPPAWRVFQPGDEDIHFWPNEIGTQAKGYLELVLCALTENDEKNDEQSLINAIKASTSATPPGLGVSTVPQLAAIPPNQWQTFFSAYLTNEKPPRISLLTSFAPTGNATAQVQAFVRQVQKFFTVGTVVPSSYSASPSSGPPMLETPSTDWLKTGLSAYQTLVGSAVAFGSGFVEATLRQAAAQVFPADLSAQAWLVQALSTLDQLYTIANGAKITSPAPVPTNLRFSIVEALFARGFTSLQDVRDLTLPDFQQSLTGTVAYDFAHDLWTAAGGTKTTPTLTPGQFTPINPDGSLTNCIPPPCLSPFGPIAYLHEMLQVSEASTCENHFAPLATEHPTLDGAIATRRGPLGNLLASCANLETPLPLIDIVNECLESLVVSTPSVTAGVVYNTPSDALAGHKLCATDHGHHSSETCHDPATLFATQPAYSSPAVPVQQPTAYVALASDFSSPDLPYSQPLDISRTYLEHGKTCRFDTMRAFRRYITEFVLDPSLAPPVFQAHLWRYPVRLDLATEYLGFSPQEFGFLFGPESTRSPWILYGFASRNVGDVDWTAVLSQTSELLARTGLSYCEFLELQEAGFVSIRNPRSRDGKFPDCEPCYLDRVFVEIGDTDSRELVLQQLAVFIRLWRALSRRCEARLSFTQLVDVYAVMSPLTGGLNDEFVRQLVAFEMLREHFRMPLIDRADKATGTTEATGADRTHLLALWAGSGAKKWKWALGHLLEGVEHYARHRHRCERRPHEAVRHLAGNLDALSRLAGFDPQTPTDTWHSRPSCTLRFAEVLAKVYASNFSVGELLFLFNAEHPQDCEDPFALQDPVDALNYPLHLPENDEQHSLWRLREALLSVEVCEEEVREWTWPRVVAALRDDFGYVPPSGQDPLLSIGQHFFPDVLEASGFSVSGKQRQYRTGLTGSNAAMWNSPPGSPFQYDASTNELWTQLPLADEGVVAKLSVMPALSVPERIAIQDLYFAPRADLAFLAFLFPDWSRAERHLIQEREECERWEYFRRHFALANARRRVIIEHLTRHVAHRASCRHEDVRGVAGLVLSHLFADENQALTPWEETDGGATPAVSWTPPPSGGAIAALLGLTGTGLLGEFRTSPEEIIWREVRGPLEAFGHERNAANSPVPTILPALDLSLASNQPQFVALHNGYAVRNTDGRRLGGSEGFQVRWSGVLLVECEGEYAFHAGAPTPEGEKPDCEHAEKSHWRVTLKRSQKTWIVLNHQWPGEQGHERNMPCLKRGAYQIVVEFMQPPPNFTVESRVHPQHTGFQLKYAGPDSNGCLIAIPLRHLYRDLQDQPLSQDIPFLDKNGSAHAFLSTLYTSTLRDIRRTYQRAFKAALFATRFGLSARPLAEDGQSELGYMLANPANFAGVSYHRNGSTFSRHNASFDFNFLPLHDNYQEPVPTSPDRPQPSLQRTQALFDWWERVYDYVRMRQETHQALERHERREERERHEEREEHEVGERHRRYLGRERHEGEDRRG